MVPVYARKAMLGSNPIAWTVPADPVDFFFDCSTTVVTRGKLEMYNKMGKATPDGWAVNKDGVPSTDAWCSHATSGKGNRSVVIAALPHLRRAARPRHRRYCGHLTQAADAR